MNEQIQLVSIRKDKKTKEEFLCPLFVDRDDVICLYKDYRGNFVITKEGFMHKVSHKIDELRYILGV